MHIASFWLVQTVADVYDLLMHVQEQHVQQQTAEAQACLHSSTQQLQHIRQQEAHAEHELQTMQGNASSLHTQLAAAHSNVAATELQLDHKNAGAADTAHLPEPANDSA